MLGETNSGAVPVSYTLLDLWLVVWRSRWLVILGTLLATAAGIFYALNAEHWYRSQAVLMHADSQSAGGLGSQLGGLAALANLGGVEMSGNQQQALAVLSSRDFAADFIQKRGLVEIFAESTEEGKSAADVRDAIRYFHQNVFQVTEDTSTGKVVLSIAWKDPELAAVWAAEIITLINTKMRERALEDAEKNVAFLKKELSSNSVVALQQSISNLLEAELQSLMLARGSEEFSFRVIDQPRVPKKRFRPRRSLIVVLACFLGAFFSICLAFLLNAVRHASRRESSAS